jgi:4-amino-4-deoxy-L-arabinose transferase-like glycosyltransferase
LDTLPEQGAEPAASAAAVKARTPHDKRIIVLVALIVALGLALRLWGIGWSLPDARHPIATFHPDEFVNLTAATTADIPHGRFDIGFYNYGAFYFYLVSLAQTIGRGYGLIPGTPAPAAGAPQQALWASAAPEQAALFLAGRLVTALLGAATIPIVFGLGCRLSGRRTGLAAALLYALAPLAVVHAHFLTVDVPATFFVALALLQAARLTESPSWRNYAVAGAWVGLAAATKYSAGLVLIAPVAAHLLVAPREGPRKPDHVRLAGLLGVAAVVFLVACPGPWLNFDAFWNGTYPGSGVRYELFEHARLGHGELFAETGPGWWYHLAISLRFGLGLPLLLLGLGGLIRACFRRTPVDLLLIAFFVLYFGITGLSAVRFARYMIPVIPVFCVWAADLAAGPQPGRRAWTTAGCAAGALVMLLTGAYSGLLVRQMARRDPRDAAADALERSAPQGASIAFARIPWFESPPLSPYFGAQTAPARASAAEHTTRFQLRIPAHEWDTDVLAPPPNYVVLSNLETIHTVDRLRLRGPVRFVEAIPPNYTRRTFGPPPGLFAVAGDGALIPEDLLYIAPTLTLYERP